MRAHFIPPEKKNVNGSLNASAAPPKVKKPTLAIKRGEHLLIQLIHNSGNIQICLNAVNLLTRIQLEAKRVSVNI